MLAAAARFFYSCSTRLSSQCDPTTGRSTAENRSSVRDAPPVGARRRRLQRGLPACPLGGFPDRGVEVRGGDTGPTQNSSTKVVAQVGDRSNCRHVCHAHSRPPRSPGLQDSRRERASGRSRWQGVRRTPPDPNRRRFSATRLTTRSWALRNSSGCIRTMSTTSRAGRGCELRSRRACPRRTTTWGTPLTWIPQNGAFR